MHVELGFLFEDGMFRNDIKEPSNLLQILLASLLNVRIFEVQFLPDVIKLIEHLEACLVLIAHLVALCQHFLLDLELRLHARVLRALRQSLRKISEGVDKIVDSKEIC